MCKIKYSPCSKCGYPLPCLSTAKGTIDDPIVLCPFEPPACSKQEPKKSYVDGFNDGVEFEREFQKCVERAKAREQDKDQIRSALLGWFSGLFCR
jgi:hypothetical protein